MSWDTILEIVCVVACVAHALIGLIRSRSLGKKVDALCLKCGEPIENGVEHNCNLTQSQYGKLIDFVKLVKPNFSGDLSADELDRLVSFVKSLKELDR